MEEKKNFALGIIESVNLLIIDFCFAPWFDTNNFFSIMQLRIHDELCLKFKVVWRLILDLQSEKRICFLFVSQGMQKSCSQHFEILTTF